MRNLTKMKALILVLVSIATYSVDSQNIALGKPAFANGLFGGPTTIYQPGQAVDGVRTHGNCTILKSPGTELSRWWVDLQDSYEVQRVTLYNADGHIGGLEGFTNFVISVGPDLLDLTNCGDPYTIAPLPFGRHVNISCAQVGRFVVFRKLSVPGVDIALCEVEVYGTKQYDCRLCLAGIDCTPSDGCSQCAAGTLPPGCVNDCANGTYGVGCSSNCSECVFGTVCNKVNGSCPAGCRLWWFGDKCDTKIRTPTVGNETIKVVGVTNNSATIEWDALTTVPSALAEFYKYQVRYKERGMTYQNGSRVPHGPSPLSAELMGLKPNTEYDFSIDTYRVMGNAERIGGNYSFVRGRTRCDSPETPVITTLDSANGTDLVLGPVMVTFQTISGPHSGCHNITSVQVQYRHVDISEYTTKEADISNTTYTIRVSVSGVYEVRLVVTNNEGLTAASDPHTVTVTETRRDPPTTTTTSTSTPQSTPSGEQNKPKESTTPPTAAIAASVVVVGLVALGVGVGIFFWRKRKARDPKSKNENHTNPESPVLNTNLTPNSNSPDPEPTVKQPSPTVNHSENGQAKKSEKDTTNQKKKDASDAISTDQKKKDASDAISTDQKKKDASNGVRTDQVNTNDAENIYANSTLGPVPVEDFEAFVASKKQDIKTFESEFEGLPKEDISRCIVATREDNLTRNRYKNIYAYDSTRVILTCEDDSDPDYINASHISGFKTDKDYIATQGPRNSTVLEFWRMMWQEKCNTVVMVANIVENGKNKCAEYWSMDPDETLEIGDFIIRTEAVSTSANYNATVLSIQKGDEIRSVRHFHFTTWEDKGDPVHGILSLLDFYRKVHSFDGMRRGPMVVHCSAGVGRTGTFIILDVLMQQAMVHKQMDVLPCVQRARTERMHMVQTLGQYYFIYDALVEFLKCADTSIPCGEFTDKYRALCETRDGKLTLERHFKIILQAKRKKSNKDKDGCRPEHKNKNRNIKFIPDDSSRPVLPGKIEDNYINAVFIDSFKHHNFYIVTQLPLPQTVADLWRLVHSQESTTVIMLHGVPQADQYWPSPDEKTKEYSGITVELTNTKQINANLITRTFNISKILKKAAVTQVKHFQLLSWPDENDLPPTTGHLLELADHVLKWQQETLLAKPEGSTVVQCRDGVAHSGLYCAMMHVLEKMKLEQEIDPFFAVRHACRERDFLHTMEQYKFLYKAARDHMEQHNEYANV